VWLDVIPGWNSGDRHLSQCLNDKAMKDPRLARMMKTKKMPFDSKRMVYGGFTVMVDA
jgi:uncharacterized protein YbaA (DUF1428 family)